MTTKTTILTAAETLALSKATTAAAAKAARAGLTEGSFDVDFTVRVHGAVKVGKDSTKKATSSVPWAKVAGLLLQRAGCTRDASIALLKDVLAEAINSDTEVDFGDDAKAIIDELVGDLPPVAVKGRVTTKLQVEVVEEDAEPATAIEWTDDRGAIVAAK